MKSVTTTTLSGVWGDLAERVAREVVPYQWEILNDNLPGASPSHAIENLRIAAGESTAEFSGMIFQDSDVAKWIEAACYSLLTHPSDETRQHIEEAVSLLGRAQVADGYLNSYFTAGRPGERWTDFSFGHELYCAGHLIEAAVAHHRATGSSRFLDIVQRFVGHIDATIGSAEGKLHAYCGHPEIELALLRLHAATGDERALRLAEYFVSARGESPCFLEKEPTFGLTFKDRWFLADYHQAHQPAWRQESAEGHAVRAVYLYTAMSEIARRSGDPARRERVQQLWRHLTGKRMYVTGAIGSHAHGERLSVDYDLPNDTAYGETCASIGLVFWAHAMLLLDPDRAYGDVMERALYNAVPAGMSQDGLSYFYANPLEVVPAVAGFRKDHEHVNPCRVPWFGCACCPPNIARMVLSLGDYIHTQDDGTCYVHLYAQSECRFEITGRRITVRQTTDYPQNGEIRFEFGLEDSATLAWAMRIPAWCREHAIQVNGLPCEAAMEKGYAIVLREWRNGDVLVLRLAMRPEMIRSHPLVRENAGRIALQRGPVVYCFEEADNGPNLSALSVDAGAAVVEKPCDSLPVGTVALEVEGWRIADPGVAADLYSCDPPERMPARLLAVPYALWGNRPPGEMMVWIRES